ncbi:hypothetical protein ACFLQN_02315 [Candidatus Aenigmatarchaeota archaeon]
MTEYIMTGVRVDAQFRFAREAVLECTGNRRIRYKEGDRKQTGEATFYLDDLHELDGETLRTLRVRGYDIRPVKKPGRPVKKEYPIEEDVDEIVLSGPAEVDEESVGVSG